MTGLEDGVRIVLEELEEVVRRRWFLFTWNTFLAVLPFGMAVALFRRGARHHVGWWLSLAVFLLFLPNAAYVLTDVKHLINDVRRVDSDLALVGVWIPAYACFFAVGFCSYVGSLMLFQRHVRSEWPRVPWYPIELAIHAAVAVGLYLGRFLRFNSWDVATDTDQVLGSLGELLERFPLAMMAFAFVVLVVGTLAVRPALAAAAHRVHRMVTWPRRRREARAERVPSPV